MLVDLAVALTPIEELAPGDADPADESVGRNLGLLGPVANEIND